MTEFPKINIHIFCIELMLLYLKNGRYNGIYISFCNYSVLYIYFSSAEFTPAVKSICRIWKNIPTLAKVKKKKNIFTPRHHFFELRVGKFFPVQHLSTFFRHSHQNCSAHFLNSASKIFGKYVLSAVSLFALDTNVFKEN